MSDAKTKTPAWTEGNSGWSYSDPALGLMARVFPLFHGGNSWYVMQNVKGQWITKARGGRPENDPAPALQAADTAMTYLYDPEPDTPGEVPTSVGGVS